MEVRRSWQGKSGRLLARFNRDWVRVRRRIDEHDDRAARRQAAGPAPTLPRVVATHPAWFPTPARIAITPDRC